MRKFDRIFFAVFLGIAAVFVAVNVCLAAEKNLISGRPYRVEIMRLAQEIEENGFSAEEVPDLSGCEYVTAVIKEAGEGASFFNGNSDYVIREINGERYRFDYSAERKQDGRRRTVVNVALSVMACLVLGVLFYVRQKVLFPFERMTDVPYELSKGNLTTPLKENRNRFFGKFVWGMDLLRENIERQKQRELELQKEKKTLLLSLSHDIKTPLSAIKLYAKAISKGLYAEPEKNLEIAENINAKADEIEGFVSEIIRASSGDFLALEVNMGEFYLSELLREITGYYREKFCLIKTEFVTGAYSDCLLKGDRNRGIEVLQNLIENAAKYGDGRKIELTVSEEEGCRLITVKNTGCTLSGAELPHIFESFWRGSNVGNQKGSGLGLYICRQLMRKMGGEVFAEMKGDEMFVTALFGEA